MLSGRGIRVHELPAQDEQENGRDSAQNLSYAFQEAESDCPNRKAGATVLDDWIQPDANTGDGDCHHEL